VNQKYKYKIVLYKYMPYIKSTACVHFLSCNQKAVKG